MAIQFTCDLCGGKLVMKGAGKAICEDCGMEYDSEYLKEKLGKDGSGGTTATPAPVNTVNNAQIDNLLAMAELELKKPGGNVDNFVDQVLAIDYNNKRAWLIKVEAHPRTAEIEGFYKAVSDEESRLKLLEILKNASNFHEYYHSLNELVSEVKKLESIDIRIANIYVKNTFSFFSYEEEFNYVREGYAIEEKRDPSVPYSDTRPITGVSLRTVRRDFEKIINYIIQLFDAMKDKDYTECVDSATECLEGWKTFFTDAQQFKTWRSTFNKKTSYASDLYTYTLEPLCSDSEQAKLKEYISQINNAMAKLQPLQKKAVLKLWNDRPEERDALLKKQDELQKKADNLKAKLDKVWDGFLEDPLVEKYRDVAREIEHLKYQIEYTSGFFKKSGLKSQLSEREAELYSLKFEYDQLEAEYQKKYDDMDNELSEIEDQLIDVECTLENADDE